MTYIDPPAKLLHHIDRIAAIEDGKQPAPVNVEIDLSNRCNLGCKSCHMRQLHTRGLHARHATTNTGDLMDTALAHSIVRQLSAFGVRSITWTGGGEPLLHPDAVDIFSGCGIDQGLYTNGTLIDPIKAAVLKQVMRWVYVSLDQPNRYDYMQYKQADQFDRACEGVRNLVRASGEATVGVGFLLNADNCGKAGEMAELGLNVLHADYVQFRPMVEPGQSTAWITGVTGWLRTRNNPRIIADANRFEMYQAWTTHPYPVCHWTQMQTVITPDGRVWPCVNRRGFEDESLGNLTDEPFVSIWSRSAARTVDSKCRVLCRGHIANLTLDRMLGPKPDHWRFV